MATKKPTKMKAKKTATRAKATKKAAPHLGASVSLRTQQALRVPEETE